MKAAVMTAFRKPLEVRELPDPKPGANDAVVRVEACGICRRDWQLWQEDWSWVGVGVPLARRRIRRPGTDCFDPTSGFNIITSWTAAATDARAPRSEQPVA